LSYPIERLVDIKGAIIGRSWRTDHARTKS